MMATRQQTNVALEHAWPTVLAPTLGGQPISRGQVLRVTGLGKVTFVRAAIQPDGTEIFDVTTTDGRSRTVRADRVVVPKQRRRRAVVAAADGTGERRVSTAPTCAGAGRPGLTGAAAGEVDQCSVCSRERVPVTGAGVLGTHRQGRSLRK